MAIQMTIIQAAEVQLWAPLELAKAKAVIEQVFVLLFV